jgi:cold shock CspA family protein
MLRYRTGVRHAYNWYRQVVQRGKGFGFITPEGGQKVASCTTAPSPARFQDPCRGERVEFGIVQGAKDRRPGALSARAAGLALSTNGRIAQAVRPFSFWATSGARRPAVAVPATGIPHPE